MQNKVVSVIRNSLAAANAALDLLEHVENVPAAPVELLAPVSTVVSTVVETAPVVVEEVVEEPTGMSLAERIQIELQESDYNLRTMYELSGQFNVGGSEVKAALTNAGIPFVTKRRRADGAELIGLSSRN